MLKNTLKNKIILAMLSLLNNTSMWLSCHLDRDELKVKEIPEELWKI